MASIYAGNVIKAPMDVTFKSLNETPNRVLVLPGVSEVSKNFNIEVETQQVMTPGSGGVRQTVYVDTVAQDPQFTFTFPAVTPELLAIRYGRMPQTSASVQRYVSVSNYTVTGNTVPASSVGQLGYAIAADAESFASYIDDVTEISTALTQENYATFNPTTATLAFAVGANGAMKFSNDLIGKIIAYSIPATYTNVTTFGTGRFELFSVNLMIMQTNRKILNIYMPEAVIRADQGDLTFGQDMQLTVSPLAGGRCIGEYITYLDESDRCMEAVTTP